MGEVKVLERNLAALEREATLKGWYFLGVYRSEVGALALAGGRLNSIDTTDPGFVTAYPDETTARQNIDLITDDIPPGELLEGEKVEALPVDVYFGLKYTVRGDGTFSRRVVLKHEATQDGLKGAVREAAADLRASIKRRNASIKEFQRENAADEKTLAKLISIPKAPKSKPRAKKIVTKPKRGRPTKAAKKAAARKPKRGRPRLVAAPIAAASRRKRGPGRPRGKVKR